MNYVLVIALFILASCGPKTSTVSESSSSGSSNTSTAQQGLSQEYDSKKCNLTKLGLSSTLGSPQNINQAIDLINALPKPVTIPCFTQALNRPLRVNATSSILSVQPAVGAENPRLFIFFNQLVISVAPAGDGKDLMEFSFMYSDTHSLKGEITFPITNTVSYSAPFTQVDTDGQSSCSGCHINEVQDTNVVGTTAYSSIALKPDANRNVSLNSFYQQSYLCDFNNDQSYRCQMIRSLFENGSLIEASFPSRTQTYFESLGF